MSGRSVTITIGSSGSIRSTPSPASAAASAAASGAATLAGNKSKDKMYEAKRSQKTVRVLTVVAYMFTVSLAAIMLSVFYVFLWTPRYANRLLPPPPPTPTPTPTPAAAYASASSASSAPVYVVATEATTASSSPCTCPLPGGRFPGSEEDDGEANQVDLLPTTSASRGEPPDVAGNSIGVGVGGVATSS